MKNYLESWIIGWATLLDGIAIVISLGFWWPNISYDATFWAAFRRHKRERAKR